MRKEKTIEGFVTYARVSDTGGADDYAYMIGGDLPETLLENVIRGYEGKNVRLTLVVELVDITEDVNYPDDYAE